MSYDRHFYEEQQGGSYESAKQVVPLILDLVKPRSVADVGCGVGTWLSVFRDYGVEDVTGFDGAYVPPDQLMIPPSCFQPVDLLQPLATSRTYDLALSLEVAEHLPAPAAPDFVTSLIRLAPVVVFSAAVPLQGGAEHVHERWQSYWADLFERQGCVVVDALRPVIWNNENVEPFYRQNLLVFVRKDSLSRYPALAEAGRRTSKEMLSVVHPKLYVGRNRFPLGPVPHLLAWVARLGLSRLKQRIRKWL